MRFFTTNKEFKTIYITKKQKLPLTLGILTVLMFASANTALAVSNLNVELSVNPNPVSVGETFTITATLKTGTDNGRIDLGAFDLPGLDNFIELGVSNQTQIRSLNGVAVAESRMVHQLVAEKPGVFTIGPIKIDGQTSNVIELTVEEKNSPLVQANNNSSALKRGAQLNSGGDNGQTGRPNAEQIVQRMYWILFLLALSGLAYWWYEKEKEKFSLAAAKITESKQPKPAGGMAGDQKSKVAGFDPPDNDSKPDAATKPVKTAAEIEKLTTISDKTFYSAVIDFLKRYLAKATGDQTYEKADRSELKEKIQNSKLSDKQKTLLAEILTETEVNKYAPDEPKKHITIISKLKELTDIN